jgi:hypothetical protein
MDRDIRNRQGRNYKTPRRRIRDRYFERVQAQYWYPVKKDKVPVPEENKPKSPKIKTPYDRQIAVVLQRCEGKPQDFFELKQTFVLQRMKGRDNEQEK